MARKSLKPQLNQIRAWARQGRTDAWIAHQLEVSTSQLRDFRKRHGLDADGEDEPSGEVELRDEIEAEIEAELDEAASADAGEGEDEGEDEGDEEDGERGVRDGDGEGDRDEQGGRRPRRRRRRGGRGRGRGGRARELEATFDHGDRDGYGLWLDPSVKDDPVYAEHWAGQRALKVTIERDRIVLERADGDSDGGASGGDGDSDGEDD